MKDVSEIVLGIIISSAAGPKDQMFLYQVKPALLNSTYDIVAKESSTASTAVSLSEVSNSTAYYSYGVPKTDLPTGFTAKAIPDGTAVVMRNNRMSTGTFVYLILNTQAISGACE